MRQPLLSSESATGNHAVRPALLFNPDATLIGRVHQRALAPARIARAGPGTG